MDFFAEAFFAALSDGLARVYGFQTKKGLKMEDGHWLSQEDKNKMESLKKELVVLKKAHKNFAKTKGTHTGEDKAKWKINAQRMDQVYVEIKELKFKNIMEAAKG